MSQYPQGGYPPQGQGQYGQGQGQYAQGQYPQGQQGQYQQQQQGGSGLMAPSSDFSSPGTSKDETGQFNGGNFTIHHRDSNTILALNLAQGCPILAKPGAMIAMSSSIQLKGSVQFGFKKLLTGSQIATGTYTGPGELQLGPHFLGDIAPLSLNGQQEWFLGKDAFLASTEGVVRDNKTQGLGKALFSGDGLFVYTLRGQGICWVTSFGAILKRELQPNEQFTVEHGHLVAWNTQYQVERVAQGGLMSFAASGEGLVCRFTGPGTVLYQSRHGPQFAHWLAQWINTSG